MLSQRMTVGDLDRYLLFLLLGPVVVDGAAVMTGPVFRLVG